MRDGEPNMYTALATMRNGYMQMQWSRVQMFIVFNTVALPLVFGTGQSSAVKFLIAMVAVGMHVLMLGATYRAELWIKHIDSRLASLEKLDWADQQGVRVRVFAHVEFGEQRNSTFASRKVFGWLGVSIMILWLWQVIQFAVVIWR